MAADDLKLTGSIIAAVMFEELKAFQAVDILVQRWSQGELPIGSGEGGSQLEDYLREAPDRISELERRKIYSITLKPSPSDSEAAANNDFVKLWLRFIHSVSEFTRRAEADGSLESDCSERVSQETVRKAARDLVQNLSLRGYGVDVAAALKLRDQVSQMMTVLANDEIQSAFGVRNLWQLVDHIAGKYLDHTIDSEPYRALAASGKTITDWLADNIDGIDDSTEAIIDIEGIANSTKKGDGKTACGHHCDRDLVSACDCWLKHSDVFDALVARQE